MKRHQKPDDEAQSKRFIDAAKKMEADESKEGADKAFKKVAYRGNPSQQTRDTERSRK